MNKEIIKLLRDRISKRVLKLDISKKDILDRLSKSLKSKGGIIYLPEVQLPLGVKLPGAGVWYDVRANCFRYKGLSEEAAERALVKFFKVGG